MRTLTIALGLLAFPSSALAYPTSDGIFAYLTTGFNVAKLFGKASAQ
jgi:hypothetical protein